MEAFRQTIESSTEGPTAGHRLYQILFGKVASEILEEPQWIILPDGPLFEAPISALVSGRNREGKPVYLVENHSCRILPSAALLLKPSPEPWQGPMLALGDPVYNSADPRWLPQRVPAEGWRGWLGQTDPVEPALQLARLASSAREARAVAEAYRNNHQPVLLTGSRVNLAEFRSALRTQPSAVHLATHVVASPGNPRAGNIALSLRPGGETELLSATTLSKLDVNAQIVVMSGCSSGSGETLPGEGLVGLTRAWLRAGAHHVTATLWQTADTPGELLPAFYRYLGSRDETRDAPERALQLAQIDMLRSAGWRSRPKHWAAYFMVARD
ncbi:MAG: CHAT domain-containing protein [bacterium]|nr:CHAT domain-containing protein [bacterium]